MSGTTGRLKYPRTFTTAGPIDTVRSPILVPVHRDELETSRSHRVEPLLLHIVTPVVIATARLSANVRISQEAREERIGARLLALGNQSSRPGHSSLSAPPNVKSCRGLPLHEPPPRESPPADRRAPQMMPDDSLGGCGLSLLDGREADSTPLLFEHLAILRVADLPRDPLVGRTGWSGSDLADQVTDPVCRSHGNHPFRTSTMHPLCRGLIHYTPLAVKGFHCRARPTMPTRQPWRGSRSPPRSPDPPR